MHDPTSTGNDFFRCDFCRRGWADDRPMVEGHQGSLVCGPCLTVAYTEVVLRRASSAPPGTKCTMCLEDRDETMWRSPAHEEAVICDRCIKQAAGRLVKDPECNWKKPVAE